MIAPEPSIPDSPDEPDSVSRPKRHGVSNGRVIDEANAKVPTIDLADRLAGPGKMRRVGKEWITNCVLDDHEDRVPSFTVNPEKNLWFCHGCVRGGDAVELARLAWGFEKSEVAMAAAHLLHEYGHPIPERPASWFRKQQRQRQARDAIERARIEHIQRRAFRVWAEPLLENIAAPDERREDAQSLWEAMLPVARALYEGMQR